MNVSTEYNIDLELKYCCNDLQRDGLCNFGPMTPPLMVAHPWVRLKFTFYYPDPVPGNYRLYQIWSDTIFLLTVHRVTKNAAK